jgi:hypothetical protein
MNDLLEALRPFAQYARQMRNSWTQQDDSVYYGVKREFAHQVTYGDFRRAAAAVEAADSKKEGGVRIVTVYLKGRWAPGDKDWDRGVVQTQTPSGIAIADNEYQLNVRTYPLGNIARIEETGHW